MIDNKDLINQLHELLDNFVKRIGTHGQSICCQDLARLRHALIDALNNTRKLKVQNIFRQRSYNFLLNDVVPLIKEIIEKIDQECQSLEMEMNGTKNYSEYECKKINEFTYKQAFKETLNNMLGLIKKERTQIEEKKPRDYSSTILPIFK